MPQRPADLLGHPDSVTGIAVVPDPVQVRKRQEGVLEVIVRFEAAAGQHDAARGGDRRAAVIAGHYRASYPTVAAVTRLVAALPMTDGNPASREVLR